VISGAPLAQGGALTSWVSSTDNLQHIAYIDRNGHIDELYLKIGAGGASWAFDEPTVISGAPLAQGGALTSWVSSTDNLQHIAYIDRNGHVDELFLKIGAGGASWKFDDASGTASIFSNLQPDNAPPIPISPGVYVQPASDSAGSSHFMLTTDFGQHWSESFTVIPQPAGVPLVAGPSNDPTLYLAVNRPCCTTTGQPVIGLVKITNLFGAGGAVVSDVDKPGSGFGSLGFFPTMFAWYPVFGVDPNNPDHVFIADVENMQIRFTVNGGTNWQPDTALTALVTANGKFNFALGDSMLVHAIGFDTFGTCDILVGAAQVGVFESIDHGQSWQTIEHSEVIGNLSRFYFPDLSRPILASSYGRGLWQLNIPRKTFCANPSPNPPERQTQQTATIVDLRSGARIPFQDIDRPKLCPLCQYIIVKHGFITDLGLTDLHVAKIDISGGTLYQLDSEKKEVPLQIPNGYSVELGKFSGDRMLSSLSKAGARIRALVLEGETLRGVIVSVSELDFQPSRIPYVRVIGTNMSAGPAGVAGGAEVTLIGEGFVPNVPGQNPLRVLLGSETFADGTKIAVGDVAVTKQGRFSVKFKAPETIGVYDVIVEQHEGKRLTMTRAKLLVVPTDSSK
jgi:hypothetical protein